MCEKCIKTLDAVIKNLRSQNKGDTIHEVATMRHIAQSLKQLQTRDPILNSSFVCQETTKLKKREVDFWKAYYFRNK